MRLLQTYPLVQGPAYRDSNQRARVEEELAAAVDAIRWPEGASDFTILGEKHANGVVPIKKRFVESLLDRGWRGQEKFPRSADGSKVEVYPGAFDVWRDLEDGLGAVVAEWETGNVSSSHRSINRMVRAIMENHAVAGYLIVPSRSLYEFLTDRIGNFQELRPYFQVWAGLPISHGYLAVMEVEHNSINSAAAPIPKGKDGNAKKGEVEAIEETFG